MRKIKLLLAAVAAMVGLGVSAQTWTAPTIQGEDPVSGTQYKVMNVGAGTFLDMGEAWFSWNTTAILSETGIDFTMTADGDNWKFIRTGTQGVFTSGNGISGDAMHVDNTAQTYGVTKLPNGYYHIHDTGGDASSLCWGNNGTTVGVVAHADATAAGWNCEWVFIQPANVATVANVYSARLVLYNEYLKAYAEGADTEDAATVYNNASATVDEINAATTALHNTRYAHALAVASDEDPRDITEWALTNADFSAGDISGWETNYVSGQQAQNIGYQAASYSNGDVVISKFIEAWKPGAQLGDGYLRQTVTGLPEGKFVLEADAIATWQNDDSRVITGAQLYITADGVTYKTDMSTKNNKPQHFSTEFLNTGEGDVIFGLRTVSANCNWLCADNFKVTFYGIDLSPYATLLAEAVAEAEAVEGTVPTATYDALAAVVTANNKAWETSKEYTAAIAAIQNATEAAKAVQTAYSKYTTLKASALDIAENTNFTAADAAANAATSAADVEAAIATLRQAFLAELPNVDLGEDGYIDVTAVMVENPSVSESVNGWTVDEVVRMDQYGTGPTTNLGETEFYHSNFKFYQTLALTKGTWEFGVTGFHRAGNHSTYFYAGEDKILIPGVDRDVVNTMADAKTYFDNGNGKVSLKFGLEEAQNVEIGIDNKDTETDRWTIFRDFTLKYYGAAVDYSVYAAQWDAAVTAAEEAKVAHPTVTTGEEYITLNTAIANEPTGTSKADYMTKTTALTEATSDFLATVATYEAWPVAVAAANAAKDDDANANVTGSELTALNAAIADEPEATTASYEEKTTALTTATTAFTAAAPAYNAYVTYKAETAKLFGDEVANSVAAPTTAAAATAAVNALKVAQYNTVVTGYPYSLNSKIGEFNTWTQTATSGGEADTPQTLSSEHWSGATHTYYEQGKNGWAATSFTVGYSKTPTLPAGDYVIKVATRASANVSGTISASATNNTVAIANVGAYTRGITTTGVASWADEGTYARGGENNEGYGWEWRFLPFTVSEAGEVTIEINASSSSQYGWVSIADAELLSATNIADAVAYDETEDNTIEDVELANVTIAREVKEGFNTVVLPFDLTEAQVNAAFGAGAEVYAYSETGAADAEDITINFNKVAAGTISANVPVLVKATAASSEQVFNGVQVVAPTTDVQVAGTNASFVGVYAPETIGEGHFYVKDGALYSSVGSASIKAFRAYVRLTNPNTTSSSVKMYIDGLATSISEVNGNVANDEAIFNLAGQRVSKVQKGLYIQNGRKFFVK